jgi:hypothetical protein
MIMLATAEVAMPDPVDVVPLVDSGRRGFVADRPRPGVVRRGEPGPEGPLVLTATQRGARVAVQVRGPVATPSDVRDAALGQALAWIGAHDDGDVTTVTAGHEALHRAARRLGPVRLSVMPRVHEAFGRAVLGALVQRVEASRSATQLAALIGVAADDGLWCWPTAQDVARTPAHAMRSCGIGQRAATVLHRGALDVTPLEQVRGDADRLDRRLRATPGVGAWTAGETRRVLGDPDAVPLGDDSLPRIVCHALTGAQGDACTDEEMLRLLAPYEGQRGRVVRLIMLAVSRGLLPRHPRRAPRAALSVHRYW